MRIRGSNAEEEIGPGLLPLIDVVFLLLVFFMLTTTFMDPERQIDLELPKAESGVTPEGGDELLIHVLEDGRVVVNGETVADQDLLPRLKKSAREARGLPVTIRGDRRVAHQEIVRVMDACGIAGLTNLAVGTLEGS